MKEKHKQQLYEHIAFIYGDEQAASNTERILNRLSHFTHQHPELANASAADRVSESDCILITYGDMVQREGENPLQTLTGLLEDRLANTLSAVHILPFFPYSSDDGFSVIDYRTVNPDLGDWKDISRLGKTFRMMFDAVINHISAHSAEFQGFLQSDPAYADFFTIIEPGTDLSRVFRPRARPLLSPVQTADGEKWVWTTFSADQIDLNFRSVDVLIEVMDILLFYAAQGAEFIRLDAVTYIWKEIGTNCINLPRTHRLVQLLRTALDICAPGVAIITETNVPHLDNIAYFGDGNNEAQMVYNFALPMLTLHAFHNADVGRLAAWADTLELPSDQATFFNFLAGHDGIGVMPVKDILPPQELNAVINHTIRSGGLVSHKNNTDGTQSPYELNINYLDALSKPETQNESVQQTASRFLAAQAIMLSLRGVPGIYFHSLFGSRNWQEGVEQSGHNRTINRQKLQIEALEAELHDPASLRSLIFEGCRHLLNCRQQPAFHPFGGQQVLTLHKQVFCLLRSSRDGEQKVLCLINVSDQPQAVPLPVGEDAFFAAARWHELITDDECQVDPQQPVFDLQPYQVLWLVPVTE